jgi:type IV pilus assembly protein PilQ
MYQDKTMNRTFSISESGWLAAIMLLGLTMGLVSAAERAAPAADPNAAVYGVAVDPNQAVIDPASGLIKFIAFQGKSNIKDGLRLLSAYCKKNIVPSAKVEGPLTVSRLYNVTFEQALDAVLGHGFKYEQDGDFVRVYTAEEYKQIKEDPLRMAHKVITLYYITADEAVKLIQPVLSSGQSARVTTSTKAQSGISGSGGESLGSGKGGGDEMALNDMVVVFDYPENIARAEEILRQVDTRPVQVLVEATIMSAILTEDTKFGIDWNLLNGVRVTGFPAGIVGGQGTPIETTGFASIAGKGLKVGFSADNVQAIITALETVADTTLLANPKILAVNKQEGAVLIGKKIGYVSQTTQTQTSTTQSVQFLETGTRLVFRPFVGNDGYIRMDIYPKDSDAELRSVGDASIPDEKTTELRTNVIVKDGETVVLGGLFRDSVSTNRSQVPVLGNLPFVGVLFRGTQDNVVREEVIILLTPHIIGEPAQTNGDARAGDIRRKRQATVDAFQMIDEAKMAEDAYAKAAKYYLEGDLERAMFNLRISLMVRPTYLEALRLQERIIAETSPEEFKRLDSIAKEEMNKQEAPNWVRR